MTLSIMIVYAVCHYVVLLSVVALILTLELNIMTTAQTQLASMITLLIFSLAVIECLVIANDKESTVNRSLGGSTYPG